VVQSPPLLPPIMIGFIPAEHWEYSLGDLVRGLKAALSRGKTPEGVSVPGVGDVIPVRSGRAAIVVAIQALRLPPGCRIAVPLYNCPAVAKAVVAAKCVPEFIDIDPSTFCISAGDLSAKVKRIDAVIAVHMFGNTCDMNRLREVAGGKPIIEDCAQSIGSRVGGQTTGTIGAVGVFSFRSGKYLSVGEGGALFSENAVVRERICQLVREIPEVGRVEECSHVVKTYLRSQLRRRPLYGIIGRRLWSAYNKKTDFLFKTPVVVGRIYRADFATIRRRVPRLAATIEQQRANAARLRRELSSGIAAARDETLGSFWNRYLCPMTFRTPGQCDLMSAYLYRCGIGTIRPYSDSPEIGAAHFGYSGGCPVTEQVAKSVLALPSYQSLSERDVRDIVDCFNRGCREMRVL
jgi:perosamine synthetase